MENIEVKCISVDRGVYDFDVGKVYSAYLNDDNSYELIDDGFSYILTKSKYVDGFFTCNSFSEGLQASFHIL